MADKKIGVVLFQLGGPDSLEAIEPFLYNLFRDPEIIDFPLAKVARPVLAKLISKGRAKKVRNHYAEIGGRSPIREVTERQAEALEAVLRETLDARVFVAMRYWRPFTKEAVEHVYQAGCDELVLLPLYPQYSSTTTGSSINEWDRLSREAGLDLPTHVVREFHDHGPYLDSVVERIEEGLARFEHRDSVHLVFSAHNVPRSVIDAGDPYKAQIENTVRHVLARGRWLNPHTLCFQSKVGGRKWLHPTLHETNKRLGARGADAMLVVPIAFVSDHVETLSEINIEAREEALAHGVKRFEMTAGLNDHPRFIDALGSLVLQSLGVETSEAVPAEAR